MKIFKLFNQKMEEAVDLLSGGGTGAPPPADPGTGDPPPVDPGAAAAAAAFEEMSLPDGWIDKHVPADLRGEPVLKNFNNFSGIVSSLIHAQKSIGADKIAIPGKNSGPNDWSHFFSAIGVPETHEGYEFGMPEDSGFQDEFFKSFKESAHKAGLLPQQAEAISKWFAEKNGQASAQMQTDSQQKLAAAVDGLKKEWGMAFDKKVADANLVLDAFATPEQMTFLKEAGLANEPHLVKLLATIAEKTMSEDTIRDGSGSGGGITPTEAKQKIDTLMADFEGPYHNAAHPNHASAVQEMKDLHLAATNGQ